MIYLDYNATAPLYPEVLDAMREAASLPLNPSSPHAAGRRARSLLEAARRDLAEAVNAFPHEVIFTASGTEANNAALATAAGRPLLVSAIEHASVLGPAQARGATMLPVTQDGMLDMAALEALPPPAAPFLLSLMLANNETGVIQPVRDAADWAHRHGGWLHCDAVQAFGKIPVDMSALGCDLLTIAAHKMGGPVGAAALIARSGILVPALLVGGAQENGRRAGTQNVAAIVGFARAVRRSHDLQPLGAWLAQWETELPPGVRVMGRAVLRLPTTLCLLTPGMRAETQLMRFDIAGIAVSAGSACASGRVTASHVLRAMGESAENAACALRISAGWATTHADIEVAKAVGKKIWESKR